VYKIALKTKAVAEKRPLFVLQASPVYQKKAARYWFLLMLRK
jgi:hypothetical protein